MYDSHAPESDRGIAQLPPLPLFSLISLPLPGPSEVPWRLSRQTVENYVAKYTALWEAADAATPRMGPVIPPRQKLERESRLNLQLEEIKTKLRCFPRSRQRREGWREDLLNTAKELAGRTLGLPEAGLDLFFTRTGLDATQQFVRDARTFDSALSDESLFQALRNLWVIYSIQLLLERKVALSAPVFAYCMLYPWTDNYLDDPQIPREAKIGFGEWLGRRLGGSRVAPPDSHAAQVGRLVALIEESFPRPEFEDVYFSLSAIHRAQISSLQQQQQATSLPNEQDLIRITVEKGGTSVLADACLVAGRLSDPEADFMFGYGVLLQLLDDLQDLRNDLANGHVTVFARQAAHGLLDELASRLWSFTQTVLWSSCRFEAPKFQPVKALIQANCKLLLLQAVARNCGFYTARFVAALESFFPAHFSFINSRQASLDAECRTIISRLRRSRRIHSAFDLLD
ncbi:MAG TPA: hypothetical protein VJA21_30535 [Verrucomicrobiae bacterium]